MSLISKIIQNISKNFGFEVKPKKISREKAWKKDEKFLVSKDNNTYFVIGDKTNYIYKKNLSEENANKYAEELNQNKINSKI
jgi:RNase H-fold protein (predicted Holliday junction resolvase)